MRAQPRGQERPKTFHGIDMHFMRAIATLIARVSASGMIDRLVLILPCFQARVDVVFIDKDQTSDLNGLFEDGLGYLLLPIRQQVDRRFLTAIPSRNSVVMSRMSS